MALVQKSPVQQPVRRIWKTPNSKMMWAWLAVSIILYAGIYIWYLQALKTDKNPGPSDEPFLIFGIITFSLVICVFAYALRRRYIRRLPGRVEDWLWFHTWLGIVSVLIVFLHENYTGVLHDYYSFTWSELTGSAAGPLALYSLIVLVISGTAGRFLDVWQTRVIAGEANRNGIGIAQAVQERLHELELTVERLSAGKTPAFKQYCSQALKSPASSLKEQPALPPQEYIDFQRAHEVLTTHARLAQSLRRQKGAQQVIKTWRLIHIPLAYCALAIILYHGVVELLLNVFHVLTNVLKG